MEIVFQHNTTTRGETVLTLIPRIGDPVVWLVAAFALIVLMWGLSESLQRQEFTRYSIGFARGAQQAALQRLPGAVQRGQQAGDLISTVTTDIARVKTGTKSILIGMTRNGGFFLGVAVIVMLIDPLIGMVFLLGGLATITAGAVGAWRSSMIIRRSRQREGELTEDLHQFFNGAAAVSQTGPATRTAKSKATRVEGATTLVVHAILGVSTCAILILTIHAGRNGTLSSGSAFTILAYILLMHNKTVGLGRAVVRLGRVLPSAERISRLVQAKAPHRSTSRHDPLAPASTSISTPPGQEHQQAPCPRAGGSASTEPSRP